MARLEPHIPPRPRRAQLRRGLGEPNVLVVAAALMLVVIGILTLNDLIVTGRATAIPESLLLRDPRDDWLHVSYRVAQLKVEPPDRPAVYIMGGSATRESFLGERSLTAAIGDDGGGEVVVHHLASNNQEFASDLAIIDNLPDRPGVVVIGVGMERFVHGPRATERQLSGRPLLVWSSELRRFLVAQTDTGHDARTILRGVADFAVTWAQWRAHRLLDGRPVRIRYKQHNYDRSMAYSDARKHEQVTRWLTHRGRPGGQFDRVFDYNAAALEQAVTLARDRGLEVVLMENPLNTEIVGDDFDRMTERYRPLCRRLADEYGATYVDFLPCSGLRSDDFRDLTHLLYPGQVKFQRQMSLALAPLTRRLTTPASP